MARHFPTAHITAVSNSASQRGFILRRAAAAGLTNVEVITSDMNTFAPAGGSHFDRVVSVEMFEHMRNWEALLGRIRRWLTAEGRLFVHVFCQRDEPYFFEVDGRSDWMARHFFTGGLMPSEDLLESCAHGFQLESRWRVDGTHYQRTSNAWLKQQDAAAEEVRAVLAAVVGQAEAPRALERWRVFHMACAELFGMNGGQDWCVSHALLRPEPIT
jgi:cyclopropane-fatty-acyl-phospholipid synthase